MPFTKFANLDFDQIKTSIKDYLRANSTFTDFDFEGSNFSVLIDTLAYNTYITAFNSNMVVNESFLNSATIRQNVVSLAGNIGYIPRSREASKAQISFKVSTSQNTPTLTLQAGLVCIGTVNDTSYTFSIPNNISANLVNGIADFNQITVYQGTFLKKEFTVDGSLDQRFILNNPFIDTSTISVHVRESNESGSGIGIQYFSVDNILNVNSTSKIYLLQEVQDEKYELLFGDGLIGQKLSNNSIITVTYIVTDGVSGNGASSFSFAGSLKDSSNMVASNFSSAISITTNQQSQNGAEIESIDSIRYFAPRIYSSQYRAVTSRDYEAIIKKIYPETESVSIIGGEELDPPEYGTVSIAIKPKNGTYVSDFQKSRILFDLKQYSISGINQKIIDLKILYVEIDSSIYYNYSQVSTVESLKTRITNSLTQYSNSIDLNKFGGRFKYSKVLQVIDNTDNSITSNITKVRIRRDLKAITGQFAQYELCFGNKFHINREGYNIKSTGFKISNESDTVYLTDVPDSTGTNGIIAVINASKKVIVKSAGTIDYSKGEIRLGTIKISATSLANNIIEIQAFPESNDIVGLNDLYLNFIISKSAINMVRDVIASGDEISGTSFVRDYYTSSYSNGNFIRS